MYININNKNISIKIAKSFYEKLQGLQHKKKITYGLLIPNCNHIHTFFVHDNIDILFLDERNSIIYKYQNMSPFRTIKLYEDIKKTSVLELPKNTSNNLKIGDILTFKDEHII